MQYMQPCVCRTVRKTNNHTTQRTPTLHKKQQFHLSICYTHSGQQTRIWPGRGNAEIAAGWIVGNHYLYTCITGTTYWSTNNRPMTTTHFLSWRPYHVTLCNLLNTVYLHTVHDTHALQGKSDFIPLLSNLLFISLNFYSHITYISFITGHNMQPIALTTPCTSFTQILLTTRVIFSRALNLAPWRWFLRKPKHVGAFLSNLECFNNSAFFNVVCNSW